MDYLTQRGVQARHVQVGDLMYRPMHENDELPFKVTEVSRQKHGSLTYVKGATCGVLVPSFVVVWVLR